MNADRDLSAQDELVEFISIHISSSLGASLLPVGTVPPGMSPISAGLILGFIYLAIFCGLPFLFWDPLKDLIILSIWGGCYLAFATITARLTSSAIVDAIKFAVVPNLSGTAAAKITVELKEDYGGIRPYRIAYFSAAIAVVISFIAIYYDLSSTPAIPFSIEGLLTSPALIDVLEIVYSLLGFFWLYVLCIKTAFMARFYGVFPKYLELGNVYVVSPAQPAYIKKIESIAKMVLFFWFGILCSIGTIGVILNFTNLTSFVIIFVVAMSLGSFIYGTLVFLRCERCIGRTVNSRADSTLHLLEQDIAELFKRRQSLSPSEWELFEHLSSLHQSLSTTARYKSTLISTLSVAPPIVGPAVALIIQWISTKIGPVPLN